MMHQHDCSACRDSGYLTVIDTAESDRAGFNVYVQTDDFCPLDCEASWRVRLAKRQREGKSLTRTAREYTAAVDAHNKAIADGSMFGLRLLED